jgi:hypothetical protein
MNRNSLRGFAKVQVGGLKIADVTLHETSGKRWAGLPSKPMIDANGTARRDENNKIKYVPMLEWATKEARDRFSDAVVAAVESQYPDAF